MRLSSILWFAISTSCIWYGTWFLARRREAQPVEQAFARQAQYRDFGRLMADAATLFFISLFGIVVKQHEAVFETAELAFSCAAFFGCCWALTRPYWGSALAGFACGASILCSNFVGRLPDVAHSGARHRWHGPQDLYHGCGRLHHLRSVAVSRLSPCGRRCRRLLQPVGSAPDSNRRLL